MKKILSMIIVICMLLSLNMVVLADDDYSTKVSYEGTLENYWELDVPSSMIPGEKKEVTLEGNWDSVTLFNLYADESVIMINDIGDSIKELSIDFTPISQVGDLTNTISITSDIFVESMSGDYFGTWEGVFNYYLTVDRIDIDTSIEHNGIIPKNATYYRGVSSNIMGNYEGATSILTEGSSFPDTVNDGDIYVYGDFEYRYNMEPSNGGNVVWSENKEQDGWAVKILDRNKTECGELITTINNKNLVSLYCAFGNSSIIEAPKIPNTVTNMILAFYSCYNLNKSPEIPESVINWNKMFYGSGIEEMPYIHDKVINLSETFNGCWNLKSVSGIPDSVINMSCTFLYCDSLEYISELPKNIRDITYLCYGCKNLKSVPMIPDSVEKMNYAFENCRKLTGEIVINANPTEYSGCFLGTNEPITLTGSSTLLNEIAATSNSGNVVVK